MKKCETKQNNEGRCKKVAKTFNVKERLYYALHTHAAANCDYNLSRALNDILETAQKEGHI